MLDALRNLCEHYDTTVVLSTATQPAFEAVPVFSSLRATDIVQNAKQYYDRLRRCRRMSGAPTQSSNGPKSPTC